MDEPSRKSLRKKAAGRRKADDTLPRSTELLERLFASIDILIAYTDRDFNFIRVNRAYAKADGHEPEYYVGKNHFALFPNRDNEAIFRRVAETGVPCFIYDKPFVYAANPERGVSYWDWSLQPVKEADGSVGGLILSLIDRTSYVRAKEAARESEERYRSLVEMMPDAIFVSQAGRVVFANPAAARMVGEDSPDSLMSRPAGDHLVARLCEFFNQVMTTPAGEVKFRGLEGRVADLEAASIPIVWRGSPALQTVARDITERRAVEKALRASEKQLRHLSNKLMTAQEKERQVVAQDLHDGIGQSLAAIKYALERKLEQMKRGAGAAPPTMESIIGMVQNGIEETRRIMSNLHPSVLEDLGIVATLNWLTREFEAVYSGIALDSEVDLSEEDVPAALKTVIFRVAQEALHNAAQHSRAARVNLYLGCKDGAIKLIVQDNGIGFNTDGAELARDGPKGLGLTSMRERVELSGGSFTLQSAPGAGTVVQAFWEQGGRP